MPTAAVPGWREVFADDFTGSTLNPSSWFAYGKVEPGGDPGAWFDPNHVSVSNDELVISGYQDPADGNKWATGGIQSKPGCVQTYGKYLVRMRFDAGVGIAHVLLLVPADGSWPPEIDFSEDNGDVKQTNYAFLHYGSPLVSIGNQVAVDLTQWHTFGVEWTPGRLVYTLDGSTWATVVNAGVPALPMALGIQTQSWAAGVNGWETPTGPATPKYVNLYVDWVVAYAPAT
jgi:beta-glucanase (GH16 family)